MEEVDPCSGYCSRSRTYHSLRPNSPIPPQSLPISLTDFLLSNLPTSNHPLPFLVDDSTGATLSYSDFLSLSDTLSLSLISRYPSLSKSHLAFLLSPNSLHLPLLYFSLLSLGVVLSPGSPLGSPSEIRHQLLLSRPSIAFATSSTSHKLPREMFPLGVVLIDSPEFASMLTRHHPPRPLLENVNGVVQSDTATVLYSSGTTGRVKGVVMSHRSMIAALSRFYNPSNAAVDTGKVVLLNLPMFHVYGMFMMFRAFAGGKTLVLWTEVKKFDVVGMLRVVERYKVNVLPASPPVVVAMLKVRREEREKLDLKSLMTVGSGGAPLGKEISTGFQEKFPRVTLLQGYALTESLLGAGMLSPDEATRQGSVGRLAEDMEAKVVDPSTGESLPPGLKGELWLRGPAIMTGYLGDDKATAETLGPDGWLKTGDLCYFDKDGFLYILDRLKELIKYKAYQVPPAELEQLLLSNPAITDAAVVPYPDEEAGEIPMAFVVRKPGSTITEHQVMDFIAEQVSPYKKIRRVSFVDSIPKTPSGKILRRELRERAVSGSASKL
ncbi:hypothetical protein MLD38_026085 [Melastoma candidum]|uniref:Uncharacterized protein n=1 Tax=Melastoma candidum TaxID=119954 RepID=A0ACB9NX65_9MYRT|nr:hypothetical protein MLD38_026085 [Melastoma candidum]